MLNKNFAQMPESYLFAEIGRRTECFKSENPGVKVISLGIGDATRPLAPAVVEAMHKAVDEMGRIETFQGYPPYGGYAFLREAIAEQDYKGLAVKPGEIFVNDGAKSDSSSIDELFASDCAIAVCDPVYPVYVDANAIAGRAGTYENGRWSNVEYLPVRKENGFVPPLPKNNPVLIYLCYPNNPTGLTLSHAQLQEWVDFANKTGAVILYDGAYESFIRTPGVPHSIYECEGAKTCAVEMRSFSKTAGFTGVRCGYTVIPAELVRDGLSLKTLWSRRRATKSNGVPYITQRAAAAVYTAEGRAQCREVVDYYLQNAGIIRKALENMGFAAYGGVDAPYIWLPVPSSYDSWSFFDKLLCEAHIVSTPGAGFGPSGEGYIRLTAFGSREDTVEAMERLKGLSL